MCFWLHIGESKVTWITEDFFAVSGYLWPGEKAQQLRFLVILAETLWLGTHITANNCLVWEVWDYLAASLGATHTIYLYTCRQNVHAHKIKKKSNGIKAQHTKFSKNYSIYIYIYIFKSWSDLFLPIKPNIPDSAGKTIQFVFSSRNRTLK